MGFRVGSGSVAQAAKQTTWGTPVQPDTLLNMTSESISVSPVKADEGSLLASKTAGPGDLVSIVTEGGIDMVLRPDFVDWLLECSMGKKASGVYTLADPNTQIPFSTLVMSRGGIVKTYPDITIRSLTISAPAQDYVRASIDFVGTREIPAGSTGAQTIQNLSFENKSYRCTQATLVYGAGGATPATSLCVESVEITIDNAIEDSPATYCSGLYNERPVPGLRNVSVRVNIPYDSALDTFRETYLLDPESPTCALKLTFTTADAGEKVDVLMPHVNISDAGGNVSGPGIIDGSFSGVATSVGSTEPITITVTHAS